MKSLPARNNLKTAIALLLIISTVVFLYIAVKEGLSRRNPVEFYEKKLKSDPENVKANNDAAAAYENSGMHDKAISVYNRMLTKDPNHPGLYVNLAAIQIKKRNPASAIALCGKAIELEPGNATAHNNLAVAYYMQGDYELAIEQCDLAIKYGYKVKPELIALLKPYRE
jgi:tetratricopeptide (TPR) repeat protein